MRRTLFPFPLAVVIDLIAVLVFAILGRSAHDEGLSALGILQTAWPFMVGLLLGWLVVRVWKEPLRLGRAVLLVLVTVVLGNIVRVFVAGDSTHWTFITVTVLVLAALLLGWRLIAVLLGRRRVAPPA